LSRGRRLIETASPLTRPCASLRRAEEWTWITSLVFKKLVIAEDGQDLLEYALLVALIALVAVAAVTTAGKQVNSIFAALRRS